MTLPDKTCGCAPHEGCYRCCIYCNYDNHRCLGCGTPTLHAERVCIRCNTDYRHPGRRPPDTGRAKKERQMALKKASEATPNADWLDLKELAAERAAVVFTVLAKEPAKDFGNGVVEPVVADVIVLTGKHAGEYHPKERILAAGVRNKLTEIGSSVVGRMGVYGARKHPGLEAEDAGDVELAEKALAKFANSNGKATASVAAGDDSEPPF